MTRGHGWAALGLLLASALPAPAQVTRGVVAMTMAD